MEALGSFSPEETSLLRPAKFASHLPRMVEEVDAVLDTRATGAATAERVAIACIVEVLEGRWEVAELETERKL